MNEVVKSSFVQSFVSAGTNEAVNAIYEEHFANLDDVDKRYFLLSLPLELVQKLEERHFITLFKDVDYESVVWFVKRWQGYNHSVFAKLRKGWLLRGLKHVVFLMQLAEFSKHAPHTGYPISGEVKDHYELYANDMVVDAFQLLISLSHDVALNFRIDDKWVEALSSAFESVVIPHVFERSFEDGGQKTYLEDLNRLDGLSRQFRAILFQGSFDSNETRKKFAGICEHIVRAMLESFVRFPEAQTNDEIRDSEEIEPYLPQPALMSPHLAEKLSKDVVNMTPARWARLTQTEKLELLYATHLHADRSKHRSAKLSKIKDAKDIYEHPEAYFYQYEVLRASLGNEISRYARIDITRQVLEAKKNELEIQKTLDTYLRVVSTTSNPDRKMIASPFARNVFAGEVPTISPIQGVKSYKVSRVLHLNASLYTIGTKNISGFVDYSTGEFTFFVPQSIYNEVLSNTVLRDTIATRKAPYSYNDLATLFLTREFVTERGFWLEIKNGEKGIVRFVRLNEDLPQEVYATAAVSFIFASFRALIDGDGGLEISEIAMAGAKSASDVISQLSERTALHAHFWNQFRLKIGATPACKSDLKKLNQ